LFEKKRLLETAADFTRWQAKAGIKRSLAKKKNRESGKKSFCLIRGLSMSDLV